MHVRRTLATLALAATALPAVAAPAPDYFTAFKSLRLERDAQGVLTATFHHGDGPLVFGAPDHTELVEAFYRIAQDRDTTVVILTGAGGEFIPGIDFASFGNVSDPGVWSRVHDEGVQILENLANIRVPVIAAVEGRAAVHSEYALLADVIVAGRGATFADLPHFAGGIVPGDGIYTTWSYRAGPGRAEEFLLNPHPISAETAQAWGVVAEITPKGEALTRARALAAQFLKAPAVTRRNTRIHFVQPLKERIVHEVGYGLALEGASAADLVRSLAPSR
jgi:enoyl-CoA hydratase/carnithine racemase